VSLLSFQLETVYKPDTKNVDMIFSDPEGFYQVPDFQRPYSWEDEHIEKLWEDIYAAFEGNRNEYFLGSMIFARQKSPSGYEVVDGQQRLASLMILICAMRDLYADFLKKSKDQTLNKRLKNAIKSHVRDKYRLTLITQRNYHDHFLNNILEKVNFPSNKLTKKEKQKPESKILNAALIFKQKLEENIGRNFARFENFANFLFDRVTAVTIVCKDRSAAITLFQVLNKRGLDLSLADLIKSHLYGELCKSETDRKRFSSNWSMIETYAEQCEEKVEDILTYYIYYKLGTKPERELYAEFMERIAAKNSANKIFYDFTEFVKNFVKVYNLHSRVVYSLWYLPNQVFWKTILTAAMKENFGKIDELCDEVRRFYYSYWIAGYTTAKVRDFSFGLLRSIKRKKTVGEIRKEMEKKMREDHVDKRVKEALEEDAYGESWLKPLLVLIEYQQWDPSVKVFIDLNREIHVDHILPEKWHKIPYWKKKWDRDKAQLWLNKMGNLTLLLGKKNEQASNKPFKDKKEIYKGKRIDGVTAFKINQRILRKHDWTEKEVKERQKWLKKQVEKILDVKLR
jgi:uncharacterized protein with ParB-like and HNH nuclease domain